MNSMQEAIKAAGVRKEIADYEKTHKSEHDTSTATNATESKPVVMKGKVKWFMVAKGYGFITDEAGNDVFVHFSGINNGRTYKALDQGDEVEFEITEGKNGPQATNVNVVHTE